MSDAIQDQIQIRDLLLRCIIGCRDWERRELQSVNLNIDLYADLSRAGKSDRMEDTVDYVAIKKRVIEMVENSSFQLLERLAQRVAEVCLEDRKVSRVRVMLEKPGSLRFARTVCVEIARDRNDSRAGGHE
jgi:D-erythro-7,8-dihydroneopterin triphosphate epimerase